MMGLLLRRLGVEGRVAFLYLNTHLCGLVTIRRRERRGRGEGDGRSTVDRSVFLGDCWDAVLDGLV